MLESATDPISASHHSPPTAAPNPETRIAATPPPRPHTGSGTRTESDPRRIDNPIHIIHSAPIAVSPAASLISS